LNGDLAHDDAGRLVQTEQFPFERIFSDEEKELIEFIPQDCDLSALTPEQMDVGLMVMDKLLKWVWQSGMKNSDGVKIRSIILCWICLKELRSLTMTDMATGYGLEKQSLGRWVDEFKRKFPTVRIPHMRS
jgi:hypothetical protein